MSHSKPLTSQELEAHWPRSKFPNIWVGQRQILEFVADNGSALIESPTGTGKTVAEYTIANAAYEKLGGSVFWVVPTKTILEQISKDYPDVPIARGQNEHACPWAAESFEPVPSKPVQRIELPVLLDNPNIPRVSDIPHVLHRRCPHYVDQTTGETQMSDVVPCQYYLDKFNARQGGIILSTMSFYLFARLFSKFDEPSALVIDEVHRFPDVVRYSLSYDITDWHLGQAIELLGRLGDDVADDIKALKGFLRAFKRVAKAKKRQPEEETLLADEEVRALIDTLDPIDTDVLLRKVERAATDGTIDPVGEMVIVKKLESLVRDVRRYIHSMEYALPGDQRRGDGVVKRGGPLNYTLAFYKLEKGERERVQYKLVIRCHYVGPLIAKRLLAPFTVSLSATIGKKAETFGYESGITHPFLRLGSNFPAHNTRLYIPRDVRDLSVKGRSRQDLPQTLRKIARACVRFARKGLRSLVVVISNDERQRFLKMAEEEGLNAVSYGNGVTAKDAALAFRDDGKGDTLVGTAANYGEGVDLPDQAAPIIFFLRPGYPNPRDAQTQFEERRFGSNRWPIWNARIMRQALQVRGRNVRSRSDLGVTFFMSRQFSRILYAALPEWLEPAYRRQFTFDEAVVDAEALLLKDAAA